MMMPSIFGETFLNDFFDFPAYDQGVNDKTSGLMKTDIMENEKDYEIVMDLPGFKKDEIKGELKDGYLIITAAREQKEEKKDSKGNYIRRERYRGNCSRSFYVGDYMRQEDIKAKFENGTLKLTVPKQEARPEVERAKCIAIEG